MQQFRGKRVLVCGASGMTGQNLYERLEDLEANVIGTYFEDKVDGLIQADFTNKESTEKIFNITKFDYVFICCAKTYNAFVCQNNQESMILPNIQMLSNILQNCKRTGVENVLFMSSSVVYQPSNERISEADIDFNSNPDYLYLGIGWVKRYCEKLCEFYSLSGININIVRPTNIYGKYDKTDEKICHVIPALVMRALNGCNPFLVYGNGKDMKDFIHVDDLVRDVLLIASNCKNKTFNLCSGRLYTILDVVNIIFGILNIKPDIDIQDESAYSKFRALSRDKFNIEFPGLKYKTLEEGLREVIQWYSLLLQTPKN